MDKRSGALLGAYVLAAAFVALPITPRPGPIGSPEWGCPISSRVLVGSSSKVQLAFFNRAEDTTADATGGYGNQIAGAVGGLFT